MGDRHHEDAIPFDLVEHHIGKSSQANPSPRPIRTDFRVAMVMLGDRHERFIYSHGESDSQPLFSRGVPAGGLLEFVCCLRVKNQRSSH